VFFRRRELGNCLVKHCVIWKMPESVCVSVRCGRGLGLVARSSPGRRGARERVHSSGWRGGQRRGPEKSARCVPL